MATKAGEMYIEVTAEFAKINDQLTKLGQQVKAMSEQSKKDLEGIGEAMNVASEAFQAFIGKVTVESIAEFIKGVADAAVQIANMSAELGITTTQYQELMASAREANVSQDALRSGFERMSRSIGAAADGNKALQSTFKSLGIEYLDTSGNIRSTSDVLNDFADAMKQIPDIAVRNRDEIQLLGRGAQVLDPLLRQGSAALANFGTQAEEDGRIMSDDTVKAFKDLQQAADEFWAHLQAITANILGFVMPAITGLIRALDELASAYSRMWNAENAGATSGAVSTLTSQLHMFQQQEQLIRDQVAKGFLNANVAAAQLKVLEEQIDRVNAKLSHFIGDTRETTTRGGVPPTYISVPGSADFTALDKASAAAATSAAKKAEEEAKRQADAIAKVVAQLKFENEQFGLSTEAQKLNTALRQAGTTIDTQQGQQIAELVHQHELLAAKQAEQNKLDQEAIKLKEAIETPQEKYNELLAEYNKLLETGRIDQTQWNAAVTQAKDAMEKADPAYQEGIKEQKALQDSVVNAAGSLLTDLGRAFTDSGNAATRWKNLLSHAIQDVTSVLDSLLKKVLGGALDQLFGSATIGSVLGIGGSAVLGPLAGSPAVMASGGSMGIGDWAIVGEQGPELIYADTPGNVLSASRTRGIFGQGPSNAGNTAYIDARGADLGAVARIEKGLHDLHYSIEHRAIAAVSAQRKRGGTFAATFNR
jgi:hypothetical protein